MQQYKRIMVIAAIGIVGIICAVYAESFTYVQTSSGIRIGAGGDPGANVLRFTAAGGVIKFTGNGNILSDDGSFNVDTRDGGYLKSTTGLSVVHAVSAGSAYIKGKTVGGVYAMSEADHDGSVYSTSSADSSMTADADGSAWMMGSGGGMVDTLANGDSRLVSSTANAVIATNYGDVIIRIGGLPEEGDSMQGGDSEPAVAADVDDGALLEDRAARIAAVKEEVDNLGL